MKTLYLLRHAKSSWSDPDLPDLDRPLKNKGVLQASAMAAQVASLLPPPDLVCCSTAARTRQTLPPFAEVWGLTESSIRMEPSLYLASDKRLLEYLRDLPPAAEIVLLVGHNPGLTDLANRITGPGVYLKNIPPAGFLQLDLPIRQWSEVREGVADLKLNLRPKDLDR